MTTPNMTVKYTEDVTWVVISESVDYTRGTFVKSNGLTKGIIDGQEAQNGFPVSGRNSQANSTSF